MKGSLLVARATAVLAGCIIPAVPLAADTPPTQAAGSATTKNERPVDMHTSRNALDWAGVYEGVLPCADCPGIKTRLILARDGRYELATQYLERQAAPSVVHGSFTWHTSGNAISLDAAGGGGQFAVGEGRLVPLDASGAPVRSPKGVLTLAAAAEPDRSGQQGAWGPPGADLPRTLEAHRWRLDSATDGAGQRIGAVFPAAGRPFVFGFSGSRVLVEGGCNSIRGGYRVAADGRLEFGQMAATMMACEPALMQADAALAKLLAAPLQVTMAGDLQPRLRLVTTANDTLVLVGQPTPEALYGAGTLMFLEVAAFRVPCRQPLTPDTKCLQVRERKYDERGLPVGTPGEWRTFYGSIDGYTHTEGERNVLRVKRFQRSQAPADASSFLYVLDLKVESEIVPRR